jgi:hypothetical protein
MQGQFSLPKVFKRILMKIVKRFWSLLFGLGGCVALAQGVKEPVDDVRPNIGGIGQLLTATIPYVQYPRRMARLDPITTPGISDR